MDDIRLLETIGADDRDAVGGKALSLGLLARAGLPVPPGFCVTTAARAAAGAGETLRAALVRAYEALGGGLVAVRSSATQEDGKAASFAGQQETVLGVAGEADLIAAVQRCWESVDSERARAYRTQRGLDGEAPAMAVIVQRLVPAEVSGVLFTRDPLDPEGRRMLVEAAWGLGEGVVSGRVAPDRYHLDHATGAVVERHIAVKRELRTPAGWEAVPAEQQDRPCLDAEQLRQLADLGRRVESVYGDARDVEWAWAEGRLWVLQARPITTAGAFEREQVRRAAITELRAKAERRGTVWARYNLAEILPAPTPMTWAIVRRFMSGRGGYGLMLRDLGFDPDPVIDAEGFIDLVCGRPYVNLSREPKLYFRDMPVGHPFSVLKANPARALYPQPVPDPERISARFLLRLPVIVWKMLRSSSRIRRQSRIDADRLRGQVFPAFREEVQAEQATDPAALAPAELLDRLRHWIRRTLDDFARRSLRPSVYALTALGTLEQGLKPALGPERAAAAVRELLTGVRPDPEADLPAALAALTAGRLTRAEFLARFGHRGPHEMELAEPRWAEAPERLPSPAAEAAPPESAPASAEDRWQALLAEAKLNARHAERLSAAFRQAITYSALRETGKHYLMMGYALIRRYLVELDRRYDLRGGIFYLEPEELPDLVAGARLAAAVARRRQERALALSLDVPVVLFSDDLEAIGRPQLPAGGWTWQGTPVSAGVAEGPALVLEDPADAPAGLEGYVLVCPSTDPAWVPLFVRAKGLVMEVGGILSHGAIVAREFGLPAVAGLAGVHRRLRTGQRVRVDGNSGLVHVCDG
jgi:pyruvate,water dikinase